MRGQRAGLRARRRAFFFIVGAMALACGLAACVPIGAPGSGAGNAAAPTQPLEIINSRHVCVIPPVNNGRAVGLDSGWSVDTGSKVFWLFGDTYVDRNGDGHYTPNLPALQSEFTTGTIASTSDKTGGDCIGNMTWKTDPANPSRYAVPGIEPTSGGFPSDECLTWLESGIVAAGKTWVWYNSAFCDVGPDGKKTIRTYRSGVAELTDPTSMTFTRQQYLFSGTEQRYSGPIKVADKPGYLYTFGTNASKQWVMARVPEATPYHKGAYVNMGAISTADPDNDGGPPSIAYNAYLGRFLAVYQCQIAKLICARVATNPGNTEAALKGGWEPHVVLRSCDFAFTCGHVAQHPELASGSKIYLTTNRHDGASGVNNPPPRHPSEYRYWNTLREFDLSLTSKRPTTRALGDAEREFKSTGTAWTYQTSSTGGPLTYNAGWYAFVGTESVGGQPAPRVSADAMVPGPTKDAVRVRTFANAGSLDISTEARLQSTCGNGVVVTAERVRGTTVTALWSRTLTPGLTAARGTMVRYPTTVLAGDKVAFRVSSRGDASCDSTAFYTSYTFDRT